MERQAVIQFVIENNNIGPPITLNSLTSVEKIHELLQQLHSDEKDYNFYVDGQLIQNSIHQSIKSYDEQVLAVECVEQASFRVPMLNQQAASMPGHEEAVLSVQFAPNGLIVASSSGDCTVRLWDVNTKTIIHVLKGHDGWVMNIQWSPDALTLASGGADKFICIWDPISGKLKRKLKGHREMITCLSFQPMHLDGKCIKMASASKDHSIRIWDTSRGICLYSLAGHTKLVSQVKWGHFGIYTCSRDASVRVFSHLGKPVRTLKGHAHWVNSLCLSTEHLLKSGPFSHNKTQFKNTEEMLSACKAKCSEIQSELLITGSDDNTLMLWDPKLQSKCINRLTGHHQPITGVQFSPDGRYIASASFDKCIKIWNNKGEYLYNLRGHVGRVYQIAFSADSRLLISASQDSTCKVWSLVKQKLSMDLPGHLDQIYGVDWSPIGNYAVSGGKDKLVKIWKS
eukprot:NODE_579_length_6479_cov_0.371160.p3 type:complete len:455 gc:universal NODE_579_length_6479_cov_0.371160:2677-4041(+)